MYELCCLYSNHSTWYFYLIGVFLHTVLYFIKKWLIVTNFTLPRLFRNPAISNFFPFPLGLRNSGVRLYLLFFRELSWLLYNTLLHLHPGHFELSGVTRTTFCRLSEPKQYRDDWPRVGHHGLFYGSNLTGDSTVTCRIHRHETVQTTRVEDGTETKRKF